MGNKTHTIFSVFAVVVALAALIVGLMQLNISEEQLDIGKQQLEIDKKQKQKEQIDIREKFKPGKKAAVKRIPGKIIKMDEEKSISEKPLTINDTGKLAIACTCKTDGKIRVDLAPGDLMDTNECHSNKAKLSECVTGETGYQHCADKAGMPDGVALKAVCI